MKILKALLPIGIVIFFVLIAYWDLPKTFFQQDEWLSIGSYLYDAQKSNDIIAQLLSAISLYRGVHWAPLTALFFFAQFHLFKLSFPSYAITSISIHTLNAFLLYYLFRIITRQNKLSLFAAVLFGVNSVSSQSVTWIGSSVNNLPAMFFLLLSLMFAALYIENGEKHMRYMVISSCSLVLGLLFKESVFFLYLFLPIYWLLCTSKKTFKNFIKFCLPLMILLSIYVSLRFPLFLQNRSNNLYSGQTRYSWQNPSFQTYLYRGITYPVKVLPQALVPDRYLLKLASGFVQIGYPYYFVDRNGNTDAYVSETIALDMVCFILAIIILCFSYIFYSKLPFEEDKKRIGTSLLFSLIFMGLSSLPYIFVGGKAGYASIFEPRFLYNATVGSSLLLGIFAFTTSVWLKKNKLLSFMPFVFLGLILFMYATIIRENLKTLEKISVVRKYILAEVINKYPVLPQKTIIFTQSDTAYYGLPPEEKILPFQSGFGQTLLVWYKVHGANLPGCFFRDDFLYPIESQGYKECDGYGFGYYRDMSSLKQAVKEHRISSLSVIGFSFNSQSEVLTDITVSTRQDLLGMTKSK